MAVYVNNQAATDRYSAVGAVTLGPFYDVDTAVVLVSGNPADFQFYIGDEGSGYWTDDREFTVPAGPSATNSFRVSNIRGIRCRNASVAQVAVVSIALFRTGTKYDSSDPIFEAGTIFPGSLGTSGVIGPVTNPVFNIQDYGAKPDGVTDNFGAIMAAYAALTAAGRGTLYVPQGVFRFNSPLIFGALVPMTLAGAGAASSVLAPGFAAGDAIVFTGDGSTRFTASGFAVNPIGTRNAGTYNLVVSQCTRVLVDGVTMDSSGGGLFHFDTCALLQLIHLEGDSTNGVNAGDTCLRIGNCTNGGLVSGCTFRSGTGLVGYTGCKPCLWLTGVTTALGFENCSFTGAGPASVFAITGIVSTGANFTVTTALAHDFRVGDFLVLRGCTPAAYNSMFRVAAVTATTITVTSALNPGPSTVNGTAESVACCAYVANTDFAGGIGSCNEGWFTGCIFNASQAGLYGSAGLYFDGRRSLNGANAGVMSGWSLTGNYYDQYAIGVLISGMAANANNQSTAFGFSITGGVANARGRAVHIDQAQAVTIANLIGCVPGSIAPIDDGISLSAGLYIYAGPAAPLSQGINVINCQFGMGRDWQLFANTPYKNGVLLDSPTINDLVLVGNQLFGSVNGIGEANGPQTGAQRWKIRNNFIASGAFPPTTAEILPSFASANAIAIGYQDVQKVTGAVNIQTIVNGGWPGRELTLVFAAALSLITGGNLAIAANYPVLAGQLVELVYDGAAWYVK